MPKISKVRAVSSRPGAPPPQKEEPEKFRCSRCGKFYKKQKLNFPASQSPLNRGNGGYMTVCVNCVDELYTHYRDALGDAKAAMQRICMKLDMYWNEDVYASVNKQNTTNSRVRAYIKNMNVYRFTGKNYDDTLDEADAPVTVESIFEQQQSTEYADSNKSVEYESVPPPTVDMIDFWGPGFLPPLYYELDRRYSKWTKDVPQPIDPATEALYKQICIAEAKVNRNIAAGNSTEATQKSITEMLGALNKKPVQVKEDAGDASFDDAPFGVLIKIKENAEPIPEPLEELKDVDGIVRKISVWYFGHLCKMLGIRNSYCRMYEDEIKKFRVERPELDEEDDEDAFYDIFGGSREDELDKDFDGTGDSA